MKTAERAVGNMAIMMVSQVITWTATILLVGLLGRQLGDAGFGDLYLATAFALIFSVLVDFGLDQQLVRAVARDRSLAGSYLVHSAAIKIALAVVAYGMILGITLILGYSPEQRATIAVYCLVLFFSGVSNTFSAVFQASERLLHPAIGNVLEKVLITVLGALLLSRGAGVTALAAIFVVGAAVSASWKAFQLRRLVSVRLALDGRRVRPLLIGALPFFLYWALGSVYYRIDVVLLSRLTDSTVVGWYGAAYRLFDTLVFLPSIVASMIMYPILARLSVQSRDELRLATGRGLQVMLTIGLPICAGLFVLAEPIIRFVYGNPQFLNAVPALRLLAVGLLLLYVNSILGIVIISLNLEKRMTLVAGLAIVVNLGLNWLLIPHFQHVAAAAVTAGTELFILAYLLVNVPKDLLSRDILLVLLKGFTATAIMIVLLIGLREQPLALLIPVGGLAYALSALLLRLVSAEDLRVFRRVITARRGHRPVPARAP
jgi:O-antigen/teichoic acid export membrane protein